MTITMSIRDMIRNSSMLLEYDYVDIEDKKSHEYKGVFISRKYAKEVKEFLEKKILNEKQKKIDDIMQFSGIFNGETDNLTIQELKAKDRK